MPKGCLIPLEPNTLDPEGWTEDGHWMGSVYFNSGECNTCNQPRVTCDCGNHGWIWNCTDNRTGHLGGSGNTGCIGPGRSNAMVQVCVDSSAPLYDVSSFNWSPTQSPTAPSQS